MISLRQLDASLQKVITVISTETDSDGKFVFRDNDGEAFMWGPKPERYEFKDVDTVAEADHIMFLCPKCFEKNSGSVGTHSVMVSFEGRDIPSEAGSRNGNGEPTRWKASGNSIDDISLTPSILLNASQPPEVGCHWHGFVGSNGIDPGNAG